jgi:uncharacterized pyridoxal phosphate-containing UPF0001 family protein
MKKLTLAALVAALVVSSSAVPRAIAGDASRYEDNRPPKQTLSVGMANDLSVSSISDHRSDHRNAERVVRSRHSRKSAQHFRSRESLSNGHSSVSVGMGSDLAVTPRPDRK